MSRRYKKGVEDVQRTLDALDTRYKEARKQEWIKEHYGKKIQTKEIKGGESES